MTSHLKVPFRAAVLAAVSACLVWAGVSAGVPSNAATVQLSGATVHTVSGETLRPGYVTLRGEKIVSVAATPAVEADETVDLTGLHLYPGLIDASTILGLSEIPAVRATVDTREVGATTPEVEAWVSVNPDSELIPVARANGITHVNVVPSGGMIAGQSGVIRLDGWTIEDLVVERRSGLNIAWPSMALNTSPENKKSLADQDRERRESLRSLDEFFNDAAAYDQGRSARGDSVSIVPSWESMRSYVRGEKTVFIHADELREIRTALHWLKQRGLAGVIVGGRDAWRLADELAAGGVPVVYEAVQALPSREDEGFDVYFKAPAVLSVAGVKVAISLGARMQESMARNLPYDAAQAMAYGLAADDALKSITLHPAQILGVGDRLGSIESGKDASLVAVDGDILDIRSNVKRLWISGREVGLDSRHTRLYEKYRNRPVK